MAEKSGPGVPFLLKALAVPVVIAVLIANLDHPIVARMMVERVFSSYSTGVFCVQLQDGTIKAYGTNVTTPGAEIASDDMCSVKIEFSNDDKAYQDLMRGSIGLGRGYFSKHWTIDRDKYDLGDVLTMWFWNQHMKPPLARYVLKYLSIWDWKEWMERMGITKSLVEEYANVNSTYFSTDFFDKVLDDTMQYTCGMWNKHTKTLKDAELNKAKVLIDRLQLEPHHSVLDIGSGWGYLVNRMHEETGANASGLTIAEAQYNYAVDSFAKQGVQYQLMDYRKAPEVFGEESFDRVVSVGMVAHIHIKNLDAWIDTVYRVLKPGGRAVVQGVVAANALSNADRQHRVKSEACHGYNYISKYIFPGGCLLLPDWVHEAAVKRGLVTLHREYIGQHYPRTLRAWRLNLNKHSEYLISRFGEKSYLLHEVYMAHCEAAYRIGVTEKVVFVFYKPKHADFMARPFEEWMEEIQLPWQE